MDPNGIENAVPQYDKKPCAYFTGHNKLTKWTCEEVSTFSGLTSTARWWGYLNRNLFELVSVTH